MNVLCICTGNICRSPMMEYLLTEELPKHGIDATVCGAGIATIDGEPPSAHAITVMNEIGIDIADHRSRQLTPAIADAADVCIVMTPQHGVELAFRYGFDPEKILMPEGGVPDPYGRSLREYRQCRETLVASLPTLIEELKAL